MGIRTKTLSVVHDVREFNGWLLRSKRGDIAEYFYGVWLFNSMGVRQAIGDAAYKAYEEGKVYLFQKRKKLDKFSMTYIYIAIRTGA